MVHACCWVAIGTVPSVSVWLLLLIVTLIVRALLSSGVMHLLVSIRLPESLVRLLHVVVLTIGSAIVLHIHLLLLIVRLIVEVVILVRVVCHLCLLLLN